MTTTAVARLGALGRAELTLLRRNRTALFTALLMPFTVMFLTKQTSAEADLGSAGLNTTSLAMTSGIGWVLLFTVYFNVVTAYVARREELVLKRLRTGEPRDLEILVGTALPSAALALLQFAALVVAGTALLDMTAPRRPDLLLAGVVLGLVLMTALAAASTAFTKSVEMAQITTMPLLLISMMGSGLFFPVELLPGPAERVCRVLPMTPVIDLVRGGWLGGSSADVSTTLPALGIALVWTALAVFAVRRWFRWEPRH
ncbi:ABC transporter permease [Streptomyces sp. URMC 123]|uniref:ABC transporter permease n=1 Tax=Streptomyces sp. URMC 123 TaxID=3423403 RepID=UPI003F195D93